MRTCTSTGAKRLSRPAANSGSRASHMKVSSPLSPLSERRLINPLQWSMVTLPTGSLAAESAMSDRSISTTQEMYNVHPLPRSYDLATRHAHLQYRGRRSPVPNPDATSRPRVHVSHCAAFHVRAPSRVDITSVEPEQ